MTTFLSYKANIYPLFAYMRNIRFSISLMIGSVLMLTSHSCSTCSRQPTTIESITLDLADLAIDSSYVDMARKVFYALPTPIEMSILVKNSGINYQPALLNDPANTSKYLTNRKRALNFGTYVTDLTYAGLFGQSQTVLLYQQAIRQLTDELGLRSAIDPDLMQRLEENIHNRETVIRIASETYTSCTASLNEEDRYFLTLAVIAGGWVEGMYIATGMTNENLALNEDRMKQLIVDQKLTFDMIWQAMSDLKNIPDVSRLMSEMTDLTRLFDSIMIDQTANMVTIADDGKTSIISSTSINDVTPQTYSKIKDQIQTLRFHFTKI